MYETTYKTYFVRYIVLERTRAYSSVLVRTRAYSCVLERTRAYSNVLVRTRAYSSVPENRLLIVINRTDRNFTDIDLQRFR